MSNVNKYKCMSYNAQRTIFFFFFIFNNEYSTYIYNTNILKEMFKIFVVILFFSMLTDRNDILNFWQALFFRMRWIVVEYEVIIKVVFYKLTAAKGKCQSLTITFVRKFKYKGKVTVKFLVTDELLLTDILMNVKSGRVKILNSLLQKKKL